MRGNRCYWVSAFLLTLTFISYPERVALSGVATPIRQESGLNALLLVDLASGIGLRPATTVLTGLPPNPGFMATSRIVMRMSNSAVWPASNHTIDEWFPARNWGCATALTMTNKPIEARRPAAILARAV